MTVSGTRGRNYYHPNCGDAQQASDEAWAMSRIETHLRDFLNGGPDYEIVCRAVALSIGLPLEPIHQLWVETREYKRSKDAAAAAAEGAEEGTAA
jgi:hypothetical protein